MNIFFQIFLTLILFVSCANRLKSVSPASVVDSLKASESNLSIFENLKPINIEIRPGEVVYFKLEFPKDIFGELHCRNKITAVFFNDGYQVLLSESYFSSLGSYQCKWKIESEEFVVANIKVSSKKFPSERLYVDKRRVTLEPEDIERVENENEFKKKIYSRSSQHPLFKESFELPINSEITSIYGSQRIFNNKKKTQHLGTDYRARVGTPIRTANSGKVVIARDLFFSGNTVVIDHGLGIFTMYGHLSKLEASEGSYVSKGDILGLSGKTGRVTGPHLHWGVIVNGLAVEGSSLIRATREYFQLNSFNND